LAISDILAPRILKEFLFSVYSEPSGGFATEKRGKNCKHMIAPGIEKKKPGSITPAFSVDLAWNLAKHQGLDG
jgi:hypothetical protein